MTRGIVKCQLVLCFIIVRHDFSFFEKLIQILFRHTLFDGLMTDLKRSFNSVYHSIIRMFIYPLCFLHIIYLLNNFIHNSYFHD